MPTFSCVRSECQALMSETIQAKAHGGALIRRVGTYVKPSVLVKVGCVWFIVSNLTVPQKT